MHLLLHGLFPNSSLEDYYFYHWQYIEAFVYFSHHFVTIPPATWTNAAHRHGVLSMGTIIVGVLITLA